MQSCGGLSLPRRLPARAELYRASLKSWEVQRTRRPRPAIVASNYADLLRSLGKARKAHALEVRARKDAEGSNID
jgi:hypothetical protein